MTTPNQPKPAANLETLLGIGAFEVGNGGSTNYGQGIDDSFVRSLFEIPLAGLDNMLEIFADVLRRLPAGALDAFSSIIPGLGVGESSDSAVEKILAALDPRQIPQTVGELIQLIVGLLPALLTRIPIGSLSNDTPNLLPESVFESGSINSNPFWSIDSASSRTGDSSGSAKVVADGTTKALRSGRSPSDVISVGSGQTFTGSVFVSHEGYEGSGNTVQLQIVPFIGSVAGAPVALTNTTTAPGSGDVEIQVPATYAPTTADVDWPGVQVSGSYAVPAGVTGLQLRCLVTSGATAGTLWFDDPSAKQTGKLSQDWISGLPDSLQSIDSHIQLVVDTLLSVLRNVPVVGGTLDELFQAFGIIPPGNVQGAAGPQTMFDSVFAIIDAWLGGATGVPGATGGSLADVTNVSGQVSSNATQGSFAYQIVNMLNNTPVARGMLATGRANYDIASANTYLATTQAAALSSSFGLLQAMPIGVISWYGYGTATITAFYINIRQVNLTTGVRDLVHHSSNIVGNLQPGTTATDADWMFYQLPTPIAGLATDNYYVEFVPVGGTHHIRGLSFTDNIKDHPYAAAPCYGTTVDYTSNPGSPSASLAKATAGPDVPWLEFAVSVGDVEDSREPQIFTFTDDGETIPVPSWCNRVDAIPLGKGGNGVDGLTAGIAGQPGQPGKFAPVTWERGTDFSGDATMVTFNVLVDGSAKLSIPSHDTTGDAGANGAGTKFGLTPVGLGPGVLSYNGQSYAGGVDQKVTGGAGAAPGGAGNGGNGLFFQSGGLGGKAAGWVCFRQSEETGESTLDTTPPTAPTLIALDDSTFSALTVTASGATDS